MTEQYTEKFQTQAIPASNQEKLTQGLHDLVDQIDEMLNVVQRISLQSRLVCATLVPGSRLYEMASGELEAAELEMHEVSKTTHEVFEVAKVALDDYVQAYTLVGHMQKETKRLQSNHLERELEQMDSDTDNFVFAMRIGADADHLLLHKEAELQEALAAVQALQEQVRHLAIDYGALVSKYGDYAQLTSEEAQKMLLEKALEVLEQEAEMESVERGMLN